MKYHLLRYLKEYGQKTFREMPFSEVDALLLSQLSYLKFDGIVPGLGRQPSVGWEEIRNHPRFEHLFDDKIYGETYRRIFDLIHDSRRYGKLRLNYFVSRTEEQQEFQFAAVAIFVGESSIFVSYRGTDESLTGWKEDFNMSFMDSVPSQRRAVSYLLNVARYTEGRLILGGHSKGGNLAVYAGSYASEKVQKRIRRIYSFDGPGFRKEFYERDGFLRMRKRFCKIVPEDSWIGMLLANYPRYRVVRSYGKGVIQHDLLRWKIRDGRFVYREKIYHKSSRRMQALNGWLESLSRDQISSMVEALYQIFDGAHVSSVYDLVLAPFQALRLLWQGFCALDQKSRKLVRMFLRKVIRYM